VTVRRLPETSRITDIAGHRVRNARIEVSLASSRSVLPMLQSARMITTLVPPWKEKLKCGFSARPTAGRSRAFGGVGTSRVSRGSTFPRGVRSIRSTRSSSWTMVSPKRVSRGARVFLNTSRFARVVAGLWGCSREARHSAAGRCSLRCAQPRPVKAVLARAALEPRAREASPRVHAARAARSRGTWRPRCRAQAGG
jgi:hypothetical protein